MSEVAPWDLHLPASAALGALAASGYVLSCIRHRHTSFTLVDVLLVVAIMAVVTAVSMPLVGAADESARSTALVQNLHVLRAQIELYKVEHGGRPPLLFRGAFPQLTNATNERGMPGAPGPEYPYGPYLPHGVPVNPYTGVSMVMPTAVFPPEKSSGVGGWLYHQETGRIAVDLEGCLHR